MTKPLPESIRTIALQRFPYTLDTEGELLFIQRIAAEACRLQQEADGQGSLDGDKWWDEPLVVEPPQ